MSIVVIQPAEPADEIIDILQRMRALAVESTSRTLSKEERSRIADDFCRLQSEVPRRTAVSESNGVRPGPSGGRGVTSVPCRTCRAAVGEPCDPSTLGKYPQHRSRLEDSKK